jgi:ribose transport system permease protein
MTAARRFVPLLLAVVLLMGVFAARVPNFLAAENLIDLAQQISVNAILAFGLTLVILTGGIDLSVGAVLALVGVIVVSVSTEFGLAAGLLAGAGAAAGFGAVHGTAAARTRMPPFIVTLATMLIARGLASRFNEARPLPIPRDATLLLAIGNERLFDVLPVPVVLMLAVFLGTACLLHATRFGQHLYAIGGNREAARFAGIRLARHEVAVYVLCSLLAGLAGVIHASQLYSGEPNAGQAFELYAIAAVVIGGTSFAGGVGSIPGTLLGAVIIGVLDKGLNQAGVHFSWQYVIKGAVILAAVYLDQRRAR